MLKPRERISATVSPVAAATWRSSSEGLMSQTFYAHKETRS